jgi:hypothetical protein
VAWLHRWLESRLGMPYRALVTTGLVLTILHDGQHLVLEGWHTEGLFRLVLEAALLLDTATGLHERLEHRARRRAQ